MSDGEPIPQRLIEETTQKPPEMRYSIQPLPDQQGFKADEISPEKRAEASRVDARKIEAKLAVDSTMPTKTLEQQYVLMANRIHKTTGILTAMEKTKAARELNEENTAKEVFANLIAEGHVPVSEMSDYASAVYATAHELNLSDREISQYTLKKLVDMAKTLEN